MWTSGVTSPVKPLKTKDMLVLEDLGDTVISPLVIPGFRPTGSPIKKPGLKPADDPIDPMRAKV